MTGTLRPEMRTLKASGSMYSAKLACIEKNHILEVANLL